MATHSSILAWGIPWTEPGRLQPRGHTESETTQRVNSNGNAHFRPFAVIVFKGHAFHEEPCKSEMPARCCYSLSVASSQNLSLEL